MLSAEEIKKQALETINLEADAVAGLQKYVNDSFVSVVKLIHEANGRVVVTGIGKSAIIAQKLVATFNSTGTPALFMHAADAIHGDLGMIQPNDVVMIISKSGTSPEVKVLIPFIKNFGNAVVAICGNEQSYLATNADYFLNTTVDKEACPNNLAPTTSTTAQMAMGDALAVCLLSMKGFSAEDFARFHPGGALGKRLYLRVSDLSRQNEKPGVKEDSSVQDVILEISGKRLGATAVVDDSGILKGIITDGDIRRMLQKYNDITTLTAKDILNASPKIIELNALAVDALETIRNHNISQIVVTDKGKYAGFIHLHDLVREGLL